MMTSTTLPRSTPVSVSACDPSTLPPEPPEAADASRTACWGSRASSSSIITASAPSALTARHDPDDPATQALVGALTIASPEFARWWGDHLVREKASGSKTYRHPIVGELTVHFETLVPPAAPDQALITYTVDPGSKSETALRLLASWIATEEQVPAGSLPLFSSLIDCSSFIPPDLNYCPIVCPPSIIKLCPVIKAACSEAKKANSSATSSGVPGLPSGILDT